MNMGIKRPTGFQIFFLIVTALCLLLTLISLCAQKWAITKGTIFSITAVEVDFNLWSGCKYQLGGGSKEHSCDDEFDTLKERDVDYNTDWITACRWLMFFSIFALAMICGIAIFLFLKDPEGVISTLCRVFLVILSALTGILQIAAVAVGAAGCFTWISIPDGIPYNIKMSLQFGWFCALFAFLAVGVLNISSCVWVCCLSKRTNHGGTVFVSQGQPQYAPSPYNQPQNVHYQPQTSNIAFQQPQYPPQQQQPYYQQPPPQ